MNAEERSRIRKLADEARGVIPNAYTELVVLVHDGLLDRLCDALDVQDAEIAALKAELDHQPRGLEGDRSDR